MPPSSSRLFGRLCAWAGPRNLLGPGTRFLSIYHDNPEITDAQKLRLDVAITVADTTAVDGEIGGSGWKAGTTLWRGCASSQSSIWRRWDALMGGWLPSSGYQPDDRPCFEFTLNDPKTDPEGMHDVELCLAVKPL